MVGPGQGCPGRWTLLDSLLEFLLDSLLDSLLDGGRRRPLLARAHRQEDDRGMSGSASDRTIILLRHAEAAAGTPDVTRELTTEGRAQAVVVGHWLREHGYGIDEVLASPATRTLQTVDGVAEGGCCETEVQVDRRLYEARPDDLLAVLREADDDGWPIVVWEKVSQYGITDEMVVKYEWYDGEVNWSLVESGSQKLQNARYTLTDNGDGTTHVVFDLEVDLKIKLPGMVIKKAQKSIAELATRGLRDEVLRRA